MVLAIIPAAARDSRAVFASDHERRLWLWAAAVVVAIYSTLGLTRVLADVLRDRNLLDNLSFFAFLVIAASVVVLGLRARPGVAEVGVWLGVGATYLLVFTRMGTPVERSHLVEYGLLAVLMLEALRERSGQGRHVSRPALLAIGATAVLGVLDESIQAVLPSRVFDPLDMLFNVLAAVMAVAASLALAWAKRWKPGV